MKGLKKKRIELNLTQKELGTKIGVAGNTITYYESGKREPTFNTLKKLATLFHCSIDDLM